MCKIFSPQLGVTMAIFYFSILSSHFPSCCTSPASNRLSHAHVMQFWPMDRKKGPRGIFWERFTLLIRGRGEAIQLKEMSYSCHLDIVRFGCDVWNFSNYLVTMKRTNLRTSHPENGRRNRANPGSAFKLLNEVILQFSLFK